MILSHIDSGHGLTSPAQCWPKRTMPFGSISSLGCNFQSIILGMVLLLRTRHQLTIDTYITRIPYKTKAVWKAGTLKYVFCAEWQSEKIFCIYIWSHLYMCMFKQQERRQLFWILQFREDLWFSLRLTFISYCISAYPWWKTMKSTYWCVCQGNKLVGIFFF